MGDDSLILREDGYIRMNFPVTSLTYHSNLNIILVKTDVGGVHVLDVNSGVILQSSCLSADVGGTLGVEYVPGTDRVFVWDSSGVGARTDYNGVLLLHTALQRPLPSAHVDRCIRLELVLSEAVLLYQCLKGLDANSIEGLTDFVKELKNALDAEPVRKGVKAQKWSTVTISLQQSILRLVTTSVVQELKGQNRRIPALAIASAVGQRANELVPCSKDEETRPLMYSEAERKETFKRWPHMDYKWALPARMAQAGFYHQPSPNGDDRAMCFTCLVCLVCWEKSDEPWVEHERHSPNCPFVRGEYTHNVPISVTNATACAVPSPCVTVVSKGNTGEFIASGTTDGKINIWTFDCGLKLIKFIHLSAYDSIFSGILTTDTTQVWGNSIEKDSSTYGIELTAMAFVGNASQQEDGWVAQLLKTHQQLKENSEVEQEAKPKTNKAKSSLVCAVIVTRTNSQPTDVPIMEDSSKALFDQCADGSKESVQAMNDQNEAKSNLSPNKMLFLLTYDIHGSQAGNVTTVVNLSNPSGNAKPGGSKKVCTVARADDANIYDDIYFQYSDEEPELAQCTNALIDEHISNVINLNASSSKDDCKIWEPKKIILTKHFKIMPPPPPGLIQEFQEHTAATGHTPASVLDFVGTLSKLKSWKSGGTLDSVGTKLADQTDAVVLQQTPEPHLSQYLMTGPVDISDLYNHQSISQWYEGGEGTEKLKVTTFGGGGGSKVGTQTAAAATNTEGFESEPVLPPPDEVTQGIAVQCLSLPPMLNLREDSKVTHLIPTEDKEHLLVVVSSIDPDKIKAEDETDNDGDTKMDVDDSELQERLKSDAKAYFILYETFDKSSIYTLEDNPVSYQELPFNESPVDLCLLPGENDQYSFASVGIDGCLRLYSLPDFKVLSEKRVPKGQFTSVTYCTSVDRLSVSTKHGMIYFYAFNNGDKDSCGDQDEDEFANIDFDMLQRAPRDEVCGPVSAPVIIANKPELDLTDLETLITLTGSYGTNTAVPYSAVVPGFWCELSPAQRPRSDHQNNRTWRLQNTSSTWDEHFLELTLPYSVSLAHVEFAFSLHSICTTNLPVIMVTLLKQNLHGIGYKKDATFSNRAESPTPVIDANMTNLENPIHSEEYLQAHNAEILAGPLVLSSGLDSTQQSGVLTLTSPRLYRARGRTFLIHLKTLFDPAKDMSKAPGKSEEVKGKKFIGCDWLHQISLTVRSSPHTKVPLERQQRIAMLENNSYLNTLCDIAVGNDTPEMRRLALDNIIWVIFVRLQRMRLAKTEKGKDKSVENQQIECIKVIEQHIDALIRNCILCGDRSLAKKCTRIMLITSEGEKQLPKPWKSTFEHSLCRSVANCIPYIGACVSPGALRWLAALVQHAASAAAAPDFVQRLLDLLQHAANPLLQRADPYQHLLRSRIGLYGFPFERSIFAPETPEVPRSGTPVAYVNMLQSDNVAPTPRHDQQLRELLNWPKDSTPDPKTPIPWWAQNNGAGVFSHGVSEGTPLHVSCHLVSDGTKLETAGYRHAAVVSTLPGAAATAQATSEPQQQLWNAMYDKELKELETKHPPGEPDPDSLEDVESTMMDCDPHDKMEFSDDRLFREQEQCGIPWAALVTRPPQLTLLVERMHSGARRYIVLDFGHTVRLTDVIIPSCQDLVTLCVDIWVTSEEFDGVKLAAASDIANKNLVLTDLQPPPLCRFMKITTIGRYGMSAMKCKIPLGWFYGEIANVTNVQASINALNALHQDLSCRFRLATGKLMDVLNPYLELYNGNAAHMMAYINMNTECDTKVFTAYDECIELQQQLHTCTNIIKKLQNNSNTDEGRKVAEMIEKGLVTGNSLLQQASTDKLRVITESVVDMLLFFYFQMNDVQYPDVPREWCSTVTPLVWQCGGTTSGALATLVARVCGSERWWGDALASALTDAFSASFAPPTPLDRCLVLVIYMCRKSMFSHWERVHSATGETEEEWHGVAHALSARALELVQAARPQPALTAAVLTALAAVLDAVAAAPPATSLNRHSRWDWVSGGWIGSPGSTASSSRTGECKLQRRKLHKKLLHQMQELEAARRGVHDHLDEQQRIRLSIKTRMAMAGKRGLGKSESGSSSPVALAGVRCVSPPLAAALAAALVHHMLACDSAADADAMMLCAKVVGRLCALSGGAYLLDPSCILGLARLAVTLPPWPRHAITTLLQDLVEFESTESPSSPPTESSTLQDVGWPGHSRVVRVTPERGARPFHAKPPRKSKGPTVADSSKDMDAEEQLTQVAESDDSESSEEKLENYFLNPITEKESKTKVVVDNNTSNISRCCDARLESAGGGSGGAGEAAARSALLATGTALAVAVRAEPPPPPPAHTSPPAPQPPKHHPPLTHTLYDVFRHLALEFNNQVECTFMENVVSLWLTLNGSAWGSGGAWSLSTLASLAVPADTPRIRLASDTVTALLHSLTLLENVSLRCWVLSMQALAWIAALPLQTEGSTQTMGRVIIECEYFVPAIVKFITMNVHTDGAVTTSELYLSGISIGAGAGAASALHSVLNRVVCTRGAAGGLAILKIVCAVWGKDSEPGAAFDLQATLLRLALPLLQMLSARHSHHGFSLYETIGQQCASWIRSYSAAVPAALSAGEAAEARVSGVLADVVRSASAQRRAPSRRIVLAHLLAYARKLLAAPQPHQHQHAAGSSPSATSTDQSQTDESKARHSGGSDSTNMEDEKKQQAARHPCLADTILQHPQLMRMFYKTISMINGIIGNSPAPSQDPDSVKEEFFWMVASMSTVAANPSLMVTSLMEFLKKDDVVNLSQAMQKLITQLLDNPDALAHFIDEGGLELAVDKLTAKHLSGPSHKQGLVSSLMNYLKLPPQLINMSTPAGKKSQQAIVETASGFFNIAPLCTISCGNPTAQAADVLLEGGGTATSGRGACAARRVRAAAWSYHFFSADDASLALTLTLPYAVKLHEVQLLPHLTSLATCPGAVGVEAGCGGTLAPLGAPQDTAGMTFIRLVVAHPVIATTVQLRLYKPRDSSNMGLLQLRLLASPAFSVAGASPTSPTNNWASVIACCTRGGRVPPERWSAVCSAGAVAALCACVAAGGQSAPPAHRALLAAAKALPLHRAQILRALLHMDNHAYAHAFQISSNRRPLGGTGGVVAICCAVRALCRRCPEVSVRTYLQWLEGSAPPAPDPEPALVHTLASVLWILQAKQTMENLHELITDDLFELVYLWVNMVPESSLLKKALDAILCSMCYIRPELFRVLLEYLEIPMDQDESMEGLTDDTKVHGSPRMEAEVSEAHVAWRIPAQRLFTAARAAMSPATTLALLHSRLPAALSAAIAEFCDAKYASLKQPQGYQEDAQTTAKEASGMEHACTLVEWVRMVCADRRVKEWAGGPGSAFWRPLLRLLCHPVRPEGSCSWQESALFSKLEEKTIRLFAELTVCHPPNQKLFAHTLHGILESQPPEVEGISGFTRALILRLVLSSERVCVALRWEGAGAAGESEAGAGAAPPHPALACHALLTLPVHTTVRMLLNDHLPPIPMFDELIKIAVDTSSQSGPASVLRSASDTAISNVVGAWELSLAAGSASKDKRIKDVKNTTLKQQSSKKRTSKDGMSVSEAKLDDLLESPVRVQLDGLEGNIKGATNLAQLCAAVPHVFGPHLTLNLRIDTSDNPTEWWKPTTAGNPENYDGDPYSPPQYEGGCGVLREFGACGGLALLAAKLPRPHAPAPDPPQAHHHHHDLDWVKLDDAYEEVVELGASTATSNSDEGAQTGIPAHALLALGLLLKLPGYAAALLDEGARAVHLLRLLLGVAHTEDGRSIAVSGGGTGGTAAWSLGTLPFRVVCVLLEKNARRTPAGTALRAALVHCGAARLLLACLAVFTHHRPASGDNSQASNGLTGKSEEKSQLYWAKGTGFGTGSTQQSWNVEQALHRQRTEEEHVTVLLQVLASYMNPGEVWPPEESTIEEEQEVAPVEESEEDPSADLPAEFIDMLANSSLMPAISYYLRNDSVLDMSRHIPLYVCVLRVARALYALHAPRLAAALHPLPRLLSMMTTTTNSYAAKLRMSKKNIFGKMTYSQRFSTSSNSELSEEDEGLATLIGDIQATSALMCREEMDAESNLRSMPAAATREQRYIELMRMLQFESFEMIVECPEIGFRFTVPYNFEGTVRAAGERAHPTRMKRLAQEASTLATSLPLSYSSSVFVRTDTDRLDVMKVLITGPSDTPYANGCFILDVYFPAEYPSLPMLINLETTGRHSVRFNPNLYNDGKVCLSVLNTWHGRPEEKWNAHTSSFLQVLVSIQSLILVPEPYFNEPGYERSRGTRVGAAASTEYNSNIYQACVRWAMLDHLRNPQPCFKEVIQMHFWLKRNEIIQTVSGWITELEAHSGDDRTQRSIQLNLMALKRHYVKLQEELAKLTCPPGLEELDEPFTLPAAPAPPASPPPAAPSPPSPPPPAPSDDLDHDMEKIVSQVLTKVLD